MTRYTKSAKTHVPVSASSKPLNSVSRRLFKWLRSFENHSQCKYVQLLLFVCVPNGYPRYGLQTSKANAKEPSAELTSDQDTAKVLEFLVKVCIVLSKTD